ncbi:MAG: prolyl oligopeptidase family serine peptidase [Chloroflexota bacterium]
MQTVPRPPETESRVVVDHLHGHDIRDPYRWLEDADSPETRAWIDAQNAYSRSLLDAVPGRERIHSRLAELLSVGGISAPRARAGRLFYLRRDGLQNQPVLYVREGRDGEERVLVDPNCANEEGTTALDWWHPSWDGRLLAYGFSQNGDEWSTLYVLDVLTGEHLPDKIERTRFATVAWLPDNSGFYYSRYPLSGEVPAGEETYHKRVFFHSVGSSRAGDAEIQVAELAKEHMPQVSISEDGRWLLVHVVKGWERADVYLADLRDGEPHFVPVAIGFDALFSVRVVDDTLYIHTNLDAPRYRVLRVAAEQPGREHWQEIIPESGEAVLQDIVLSGGRIIGRYLWNATALLTIFDRNGSPEREVGLPGLGTIMEVNGQPNDPDAYFSFESFVLPRTVYQLDQAGRTSVWAAIDAPIRTDDYMVSQEWYTSRDGTRVSMFLVHRKDLDRHRSHPTLLTGYGGFNISNTPVFISGLYLWLEHGGIFAEPNLRGGGEYGEEWHRAGMLDRKQNVFDDFLGAAECLIEKGYTVPERLTISGGSNGGLLVGAALTQRPDLFAVVTCGVPLLDMLRYHLFQIARLWIPEYGTAEDPDQFRFISAYSPYQNVRDGTAYPAVLLHTAASDTRVDPMHACKMAAQLQAATSSDRPILLRVETQAGHGIGKPLVKVIEEQTDIWSFRFWQLGIEA